MNTRFVERRQSPRVDLRSGLECRLDLRTRVRMVDISLSGTLLAAELALPAGAAGELRSGLGVAPFSSNVEVRRTIALTSGTPENGIGVMFTTMDERSRRSLEEFLRKASE